MAEIIFSKYTLAGLELLVIAVLLVMLIRQGRKKKAEAERRQIRQKKMRNSELDRMLQNPELQRQETGEAAPFEVKYRQELSSISSPLAAFQIEAEVRTQTSVRRYLFDLDRELTIGRDKDNALQVEDPLIAGKCCAIFLKKRSVFLRNCSKARPLSVVRGSQSQTVTNRIVRLNSKDVIRIGGTTVQISIYEN